MTSAPTEVSDGPPRPALPGALRWLTVGRGSTAAALLALVLLQWLNQDWFPPEISVSQYGIGPRGWIFTCWSILLAVSVLSLALAARAAGARQARFIFYWLSAGSAGLLVMGIVRTDAGGAQHSWNAKVHMVASIFALMALPVSILLALSGARRPWRRMALAVTAVSAMALLLVLSSAFGVRTLGLDAQHSWALWQAVAVTADMLLVTVFALADVVVRSADHSAAAGDEPGVRQHVEQFKGCPGTTPSNSRAAPN